MVWNLFDVLDRTIVCNKLILNIRCPQIDFDKIFNKMLINAYELASEHSSGVNVSSEWLEAFVVSKNLRSGCGGHGGNEEGVSDTMLHDILSKLVPIISLRDRFKVIP